MKALIVINGYFPAKTYGGPPVSIKNLCSLLHNEVDFYILCSDHELNSKIRLSNISDGWNFKNNCKVLYIQEEHSYFFNYKRIIKELSPDFIYLNSLFSIKTTIPFLLLAKQLKLPVLLASRGELCINAFDKKYKKIPYIWVFKKLFLSRNVFYQSTSNEEYLQIQKLLHVSSEHIFQISNIPTPNRPIRNFLLKEPGTCNLVFISRIEHKKNLAYALNILKKVKSNIIFDIYGPIENLNYWYKCQSIMTTLPDNIRASYKGILDHDDVSKTFAKYHAFLFPTLSENYGHAMVEAMLQQCIIITSDQVPWNDINNSKSGWSIPLRNTDSFICAIECLANMDQEQFNELTNKCKEYTDKKINFKILKNNYMNCFRKITAMQSTF